MFSRIRNLTVIKANRLIHSYNIINNFRNELRIFNNINNKGLIYHNIPYGCTNLHMKVFNETKILNNYVNVVYTGEYTGRSPKDKYFV